MLHTVYIVQTVKGMPEKFIHKFNKANKEYSK